MTRIEGHQSKFEYSKQPGWNKNDVFEKDLELFLDELSFIGIPPDCIKVVFMPDRARPFLVLYMLPFIYGR